MDFWGIGLYSGDFACDLRATIAAVVRLPFHSDRLVEILCETEPAAANNVDHEDHNTFWIVVADQFAKRGILSDRLRDDAETRPRCIWRSETAKDTRTDPFSHCCSFVRQTAKSSQSAAAAVDGGRGYDCLPRLWRQMH